MRSAIWTTQGGLDGIKQYEDAGVHRLLVPLILFGNDPVAGVKMLGDTLISKM